MSKRKTPRKRKATASVSKPDGDSTVIRGGIYTRFRVDGKVQDDFGRSSTDPEDYRKELNKWLDVYEAYAIGRFGPQGKTPAEVDASHNESRQVLEALTRINWMRDALAAGTDPYILYGAMQAGHELEKLYVVRHEPDAAKGKRSKAHVKTMRDKRIEKFSASREAIREECQRRLRANPKLQSKRTTVRDALYRHFLKKGKQQRGYSRSAIFTHIRDLFDPEG